ncbi:hypothetical protein PISMIDRAFT_676202 [Pisolithus microcarpus 441]|uniref:Uncharacterized protein n=1 Tax=Pisolithus microcarpus 441 TaxID=765257 RepID=A0A0C9ZK96_9AGAM|nr:hypothetical protein PISMIDRAFT_676202 [Pisolithus microcarpus 441]
MIVIASLHIAAATVTAVLVFRIDYAIETHRRISLKASLRLSPSSSRPHPPSRCDDFQS